MKLSECPFKQQISSRISNIDKIKNVNLLYLDSVLFSGLPSQHQYRNAGDDATETQRKKMMMQV
jgi:hypothetical protein